jgi:uncharacterized damage-inducible protein DinB
MTIAQSLLPELDQEMANTRKVLERLPDDKFAWKPHEKSMSLGTLASHLANLPNWGFYTLDRPSLDLAPIGGEPLKAALAESRAQALEIFDANLARFRPLLAQASDASLIENWSLLVGGNAILTMPRIAVIRGMVINHMIHHRAQLTVYFRLNDIPVPALYGPSADEK